MIASKKIVMATPFRSVASVTMSTIRQLVSKSQSYVIIVRPIYGEYKPSGKFDEPYE